MLLFIAIALGVVSLVLFFGSMYNATNPKQTRTEKVIAFVAGLLILLVGGGASCAIAYGYPQYLVYQQEQEGKAELAKAEQNRQIAIQEAKAKEESAHNLANAKRIEAEGIANANQIIINSLNGPELYIQYLWTEALKNGNNQTIYVPSNAGIPVTEANRLQNNK